MHAHAAAQGPSLRASLWVFVTLAAAACALTLLFLGTREVMAIGGACADGNAPYVIARPCPRGTAVSVVGGIFLGLVAVGLYVVVTTVQRLPALTGLVWPALFLSLGWNFFEFGLRPPVGDGVVWGWLLTGVVFAAMGGVPLLFTLGPTLRAFAGYTGDAAPAHPRPRAAPRSPAPLHARAPAGGADAVVYALERLAELHRTGVLNDAEFGAAKRRVVGEEVEP
jgi:hypothetical protein